MEISQATTALKRIFNDYLNYSPKTHLRIDAEAKKVYYGESIFTDRLLLSVDESGALNVHLEGDPVQLNRNDKQHISDLLRQTQPRHEYDSSVRNVLTTYREFEQDNIQEIELQERTKYTLENELHSLKTTNELDENEALGPLKEKWKVLTQEIQEIKNINAVNTALIPIYEAEVAKNNATIDSLLKEKERLMAAIEQAAASREESINHAEALELKQEELLAKARDDQRRISENGHYLESIILAQAAMVISEAPYFFRIFSWGLLALNSRWTIPIGMGVGVFMGNLVGPVVAGLELFLRGLLP